MGDPGTMQEPTATLAWTTIEACAENGAAETVAQMLLTAGITVRIVGPEDWREAGVEVPNEPWEVQIPSDAFDQALDVLETWDAQSD